MEQRQTIWRRTLMGNPDMVARKRELFAQYVQDRRDVPPDVLHIIQRDLPRTFPKVPWVAQHAADIVTLLTMYAAVHKGDSYLQGFNYHMTIMYHVFAGTEHAWADTWWCFSRVIGLVRPLMPDFNITWFHWCRRHWTNDLFARIRKSRPQLHSILDNESEHFSTLVTCKWFFLWFAQTVPWNDIFELWDILVQLPPKHLLRIYMLLTHEILKEVAPTITYKWSQDPTNVLHALLSVQSYTKRLPNIDSEFKERVLVAYSLLSDEMKQRPAHHVATHLAEHFLAAEPKKKKRAKVPTRRLKPLALLIMGILATVGDVANGTLHQIASAPETAGDAYMDVINGAQLALQRGDDNDGDENNELVKEVLDEEETDDEDLTEDEEQQEEKDDTDKGKLVEFKEKLNQNQGWFSFMDPNDDSRLQTNAAYAAKVIGHASNVMKDMSASDARKLQKYAKPIRELISKDLLKQMLSHDRNFVRSSLDLAINDGTEEQKKELKKKQQERIQKAITTYSPIVDQHTESGFTESFVNQVVEEISDGDAIVDWYNANVNEKTPEQLFRTYTHKYSVDIQNKLEKMNPLDLNRFSEEFYFKIVIMNVALSSKKLSEKYTMKKKVEDRVPKNKLESIILDEYINSCQEKSGIHMPTSIRKTIKLYGVSRDDDSRTGEIIEAVRDLWKLQDVNMTKDLLEAEKAKEDELNQRFSDKFTRLGDMAKARAEGAKEIYEKVLAVGKEYLYNLLYACVGLGALYVIRKSRAPERVMDGGETKQNEETKQSEPQQPRPRAKTPIRLDDMVTNQDVYELIEKTPKQYYWIREDNQFIRISTKKAKPNENKPERYWKRLKSPKWKKSITDNINFKKIGYIDGNGVLNFF